MQPDLVEHVSEVDNAANAVVSTARDPADNSDRLPATPSVTRDSLRTNDSGVFYRRLMKSYVGVHGDKLSACPADNFYYAHA